MIIHLNHITKTESYFYDCETGRAAEIIFVNDKFDRCNYFLSKTYTRKDWSLLAEIEKEIARIEEMKTAPSKLDED